MGLFGKLSEMRMKDPVEGTARVVGINMPSPSASSQNYRMQVVVTGPGIEPTACSHKGIASTKKWPSPGEDLPITVDREDPTHFVIRWDDVTTGHDQAVSQAAALAEQMRQHGTASAPPLSTAGGPVDTQAILAALQAATSSTGAIDTAALQAKLGGVVHVNVENVDLTTAPPTQTITAASILATGKRGSATLLGTFPTNQPPVDADHTMIGLMLNVMIDGHPPYQTQALYNTPTAKLTKLTPGALLPVAANPELLAAVAVDWDKL